MSSNIYTKWCTIRVENKKNEHEVMNNDNNNTKRQQHQT